MITLLPLVVAVTAAAALPARSVAVMENATVPCTDGAPTTRVPCQVFPLGFASIAPWPAMVTTGV